MIRGPSRGLISRPCCCGLGAQPPTCPPHHTPGTSASPPALPGRPRPPRRAARTDRPAGWTPAAGRRRRAPRAWALCGRGAQGAGRGAVGGGWARGRRGEGSRCTGGGRAACGGAGVRRRRGARSTRRARGAALPAPAGTPRSSSNEKPSAMTRAPRGRGGARGLQGRGADDPTADLAAPAGAPAVGLVRRMAEANGRVWGAAGRGLLGLSRGRCVGGKRGESGAAGRTRRGGKQHTAPRRVPRTYEPLPPPEKRAGTLSTVAGVRPAQLQQPRPAPPAARTTREETQNDDRNAPQSRAAAKNAPPAETPGPPRGPREWRPPAARGRGNARQQSFRGVRGRSRDNGREARTRQRPGHLGRFLRRCAVPPACRVRLRGRGRGKLRAWRAPLRARTPSAAGPQAGPALGRAAGGTTSGRHAAQWRAARGAATRGPAAAAPAEPPSFHTAPSPAFPCLPPRTHAHRPPRRLPGLRCAAPAGPRRGRPRGHARARAPRR
jgi:hypothetical protein